MFAYCNNNSVVDLDPNGTKPFRTYGDITLFLDTGTGSPLINGQRVCKYNATSFADSTIADSGCGPIACYNAIELSGKNVSFWETVDYFENNYIFLPTRCFGVSPKEIASYLDYKGIDYSVFNSLNSLLQDSCSPGDVVIALFWNKKGGNVTIYGSQIGIPNVFKGAHYVAFKCTNSGVIIYNYNCNSLTAKTFNSFEEYIKNGVFFKAYKIN